MQSIRATDQPMAPRGLYTEHSQSHNHDNRKKTINVSNHLSLFISRLCTNLKRTRRIQTHRATNIMVATIYNEPTRSESPT